MIERRRYRSIVSDSDRWTNFPFRDGDIVITTPPKCGTTWTQMLCALLIFDSTVLPKPLSELSPWLDMQTRPPAEVLADLEAQEHRRFIKTHTPLDGLPLADGVTYVCVGRDPRDVSQSWVHHFDNIDGAKFIAVRAAAVGLDDLAELGPMSVAPDDPLERFWQWADDDDDDEGVGVSLKALLAHLHHFWERRHEPSFPLFHYSDLKADLPGQLARLASVLGIERPASRIEGLAEAARFDQMKANADSLIPNSDQGFWKSTTDFFHRGSSGQWRDLLSEDDLARYDKRVAELAEPDFAAWVHGGWLGASEQRV